MSHFACHKFQAAPRRFMIEPDCGAGEHAVAFPVIYSDVMTENLGNTVRTPWIEGSLLGLGTLVDFAEHLRTRGLQEFSLRPMPANSFENAYDPKTSNVAREHGLVPRNRNKTLSRQIVHFVRLNAMHHMIE